MSVTLPDIHRMTDLGRARQAWEEYGAKLFAEEDRRTALTAEQRLAEHLNSRYSREPDEAWYYEGDDWHKPEHGRWLGKAQTLLTLVNDDEELAYKLADLLR